MHNVVKVVGNDALEEAKVRVLVVWRSGALQEVVTSLDGEEESVSVTFCRETEFNSAEKVPEYQCTRDKPIRLAFIGGINPKGVALNAQYLAGNAGRATANRSNYT